VSWRDASYCVVDLELTGLDPRLDEIVSWATVPIEAGRIRLGAIRSGLVRPRRAMPAAVVRVHGIRPADLEHAPAAPEALAPLLEAMRDRVLVAHAAYVERAFLPERPRIVIDTEILGRRALGVAGHLQLSELARRLGLPVHPEHEATGDALTTAQVFLALVARLERRHPQSVRSLSRPTLAERTRWLAVRRR
jgi:DNA polymerase III subunit epsilon